MTKHNVFVRVAFKLTNIENMNKRELERVQVSWEKVAPNADKFVQLFYNKLFELDPQLQSLFKRSMRMQGRKIMSMFSSAVEYMGHTEKVLPPLIAAGKRHIQYGVADKDYETVRQALMQTMSEALGEEFDSETRLAWELAYNSIQDIMKSACH